MRKKRFIYPPHPDPDPWGYPFDLATVRRDIDEAFQQLGFAPNVDDLATVRAEMRALESWLNHYHVMKPGD